MNNTAQKHTEEITLTVMDIARQVNLDDAMKLKKGEMMLVRSDNKYEIYGDHYALITGGIIQKPRGLRLSLVTLPPLDYSKNLIESFTPIENKTLLVLTVEATAKVMEHYGLHMSEGDLISI
jgi:hypothetical protein